MMSDSFAWRWSAVVLVSLSIAASYFFYDAVSPLKMNLMKELGWSNTDFGNFTGAYAWPNVFLLMAIFGGVIADSSASASRARLLQPHAGGHRPDVVRRDRILQLGRRRLRLLRFLPHRLGPLVQGDVAGLLPVRTRSRDVHRRVSRSS